MSASSSNKNGNSSAARHERIAIRSALYAIFFTAAAAEIFFLINRITDVSLNGSDSIGPVALWAIGIVAPISFITTYYKTHRQSGWSMWYNAIMLGIGYSLIYFVGTLLALLAFHRAFSGIIFGPIAASFIVGVTAGIIVYLAVNAGANITIRDIVTVFSLVLLGGILFAMATNTQPNWWQANFSFLGFTNTAYTFNLTLIFSAVMLLVLIENVLQDFNGKHVYALRAIFIFIAFTLGGVGLFPYIAGSVVFRTMHYVSAYSMIAAFIVLIGGSPWLVRRLSAEFLVLTYVLEGGLILSYFLLVFFRTITVTGFEFASFGMCFSWLVLLFKNISLSDGSISSPLASPEASPS